MTFFEQCDEDGDGVVTEDEFVQGVTHWNIAGLKEKQCREIYKVMDANENDALTIGEIWMYIEGAQPSIAERGAIIEKELERDMDDQINAIFNEFKLESKTVTRESVRRILTAYSVPSNVITKTLEDVAIDGNGQISKKNFKKFMMDFLKENILEVENDINELRAMFYEADLDKSGFLDMDELYNFFKVKLKANITRDELKNLVRSVDLDYNLELDVDEFIDLMTKNPSEKGGSGSAQATYLRIKKSRKFDMTEFVKFLKKFPDHFEKSFTTSLYRNKKHLPSSAFISYIIPHDEESVQKDKKVTNEPTIKTTIPDIAAQITFDNAKGVPYPEESKVELSDIIKRVVRVSVFDFDKNRFLANSTYVVAKYNDKYKDQWKFNRIKDTGTNPILFRTDELQLKDKNVHIVFEFVIYCKQGTDDVKEINSGWASIKISELTKKTGKAVLDILGGSPQLQNEVSFLDKNKKMVKGKSKLTIYYRGLKDFSDKSQLHFQMLPSTCLLQKRYISFIVGFRNYLGREKFSELNHGEALTIPSSNFMLVTFPRILDNPDFCENVLEFWNDKIIKKMKEKDLFDINKLINLVETNISKLYPVAFSTDFN